MIGLGGLSTPRPPSLGSNNTLSEIPTEKSTLSLAASTSHSASRREIKQLPLSLPSLISTLSPSLCGIVSIGMGSSVQPVRQRHRHRQRCTDGRRTKAPSFPPPVCPSVVRASFFLALFAANDEFSFQRACNWLQEGRRTPPRHIYSPLLRTIYWHNLSQKHVLA